MQPGPGPLSGAGQHVAAADDTCASIAKKLGLDAQALVRINKERYPALTKHAKLMADTLLLLPPAGTGDGAPAGDDRSTGKRKRTTEHASGNAGGLKQDGRWPIEVGRLMSTPVFYPSEEEFKDFYSYMQKLDRLVGHVGVCKVVPPKGWQARPHDLYNLQDSTKELEESIQVKRPIKQNAIGGKGLYANVHEVKRSMKLADFKKAATSKEFSPPVDAQFRDITDEDVDVLERRFWRNVLFNPPMYGADCPAPFGLRSDGGEGLFDPMTCGDWDLAKLPSLLTHGIKKRVPGVNTPYLYVGMYRAAFAWHCEDMDLHSINYLHWGAPKTWYTVPSTHGRKLEQLACREFPVQAAECREFLRHKSVMIEPSILIKAKIPLTRTVQRPGEFIINFPGAYHSGFNNGYNCAESCNFATEYWIPFGVQAKPCSCAGGKDSVRINIGSIIKKIGVNNVKIKGDQWVQCDECSKWRLLPPYLMHLVRDDANELSSFTCQMIEGMTCSVKQSAAATADDGEAWEIDGKVQLGMDESLEQWVMCEQCSKWRRLHAGHAIDADAAFVCTMLAGVTCQDEEEKADLDGDDRQWSLMEVTTDRTKVRAWTAEDEKRMRVSALKEELNGYCINDMLVAECGDKVDALEALVAKTKEAWDNRWERVHAKWLKLSRPLRGADPMSWMEGVDESKENDPCGWMHDVDDPKGWMDGVDGSGGGNVAAFGETEACQGGGKGLLVRNEMVAKAACVAQKLWLLTVEAEEEREVQRKRREAEKRRCKAEAAAAEVARSAAALTEAVCTALGTPAPAPRAAAVKIEASGGAGGAQVAEELEEWRYAAVPVTVLGLPDEVMSSPVPGFDDKTWTAAVKLLSPHNVNVRSVKLHSGSRSTDSQLTASVAASTCQQSQAQIHQSSAAGAIGAAGPAAGWKMYSTAEGRHYYHHAASQTTTWDAPPGWGSAPNPAPLAPAVQWEMVHLRPVTQAKEQAVVDKLLAGLAPPAAAGAGKAPCAVLLRDIKVAVGYWHRNGVETKPRLDALLMSAARKHMLDLLCPVLKDALASPVGGGADAGAANPKSWMNGVQGAGGAEGEDGLTVAGLSGGDGVMSVEAPLTRAFWTRAAAMQQEGGRSRVADVAGGGEAEPRQRYLVVQEAEILADVARSRAERGQREAQRHAEWVQQQQQLRAMQALQQARPQPGGGEAEGMSAEEMRRKLQLKMLLDIGLTPAVAAATAATPEATASEGHVMPQQQLQHLLLLNQLQQQLQQMQPPQLAPVDAKHAAGGLSLLQPAMASACKVEDEHVAL